MMIPLSKVSLLFEHSTLKAGSLPIRWLLAGAFPLVAVMANVDTKSRTYPVRAHASGRLFGDFSIAVWLTTPKSAQALCKDSTTFGEPTRVMSTFTARRAAADRQKLTT